MNMGKNDKIIVLVAEGCPACADLKGKIGKDKRFELMDVTSNAEAKRLATELGVNAVPTFLYPNKTGGICVLDDDGKAGKCIKGEHQHAKK
jgi:thioredoxin-related protein